MSANVTDWITAIGTAGGFLATAAAVWVGFIAIKDGRKQADEARQEALEAQRQTQEAQYDLQRPLLRPKETANLFWSRDRQIEFSRPIMQEIENFGLGIALNINGVIFGLPGSNHMTLYTPEELPSGKPSKLSGKSIGGLALKETMKIKDYPLVAPEEPKDDNGQPLYWARLTLTYHDIFGRKHASIFDCRGQDTWEPVVFLKNIPADLDDLHQEALRTSMPSTQYVPARRYRI